MISLKDLIALGTLAGIVIPGGVYVHDIKRDLIQLSESFIGDQMLRNQREIWTYQDRLKSVPNDNAAADRLRQLEYEKKLLEYKQRQIQGGS